MNLHEHVIKSEMGTNYGPWKTSGSNFTEGGETGTDYADGTPKKKSFWKSVGDAVKNNVLPALQALLTGKLGSIDMGKSWPTEPMYNDATDTLDVGRHLIQQDKLRRFHLGNEYGSQSYNDIFLDGFEDPTALTFKVEFGEWGASISEMSEIAAFQKNSLIHNTWLNDYDSMPMGLLNLNFMVDYPDDYDGKYTFYNFNDQETYNAANYLYSRNQDRRAQYLRDFVEGLYVLQKDFPYLFQKINGIDKLADFDSLRGQRLKDVTLKLTCLSDGIDLKLRTLLELYRKAAWDDVYQRWALPDIHRYFKMIIYVFDRRAITMSPGLLSPDTEFSPIIAYECGPCEFVIKSEDRSDYSQNYYDDSSSQPTIDIKVYNVKTFMVNKMFQRVKYINDLMTPSQHDGFYDELETPTNGQSIAWQFVWMQKMFMLPDEFALGATWNSATSRTAKVHYFADWNDDEMMNGSVAATNTIDQEMDNTWHYATVKDEGYVIRNFKDLWNSVKDVVTSRTQLIRDSRTSNRYYFVNDMARLYDEPYTLANMIAHNMVRIDIPGAMRDLRHRIRQLVQSLLQWQLDMNLDKNCEPMTDIVKNLEKLEDIPEDMVLEGSEPIEQNFIDLSIYDEKPCSPYVDISINDDKMDELNKVYITGGENPEQSLIDLSIYDDKPCSPYVDISINDSKMDDVLPVEITGGENPDQSLIDLSIYDDKPC